MKSRRGSSTQCNEPNRLRVRRAGDARSIAIFSHAASVWQMLRNCCLFVIFRYSKSKAVSINSEIYSRMDYSIGMLGAMGSEDCPARSGCGTRGRLDHCNRGDLLRKRDDLIHQDTRPVQFCVCVPRLRAFTGSIVGDTQQERDKSVESRKLNHKNQKSDEIMLTIPSKMRKTTHPSPLQCPGQAFRHRPQTTSQPSKT